LGKCSGKQHIQDDELESLRLKQTFATAQGFVFGACSYPEQAIEILLFPAMGEDRFGRGRRVEGIREIDPSCENTPS
jgi:hypothetical protein